MRRLALSFVLALACGCGGTTFVRATVDGPSDVAALFLDLDFDTTHRQLTHQPITRDGATPSLPTSFGVKLPDVAGTLTLTVTGQRTSGDVLTATRVVPVTPHQERDVELALAAGIADLADLAAPASADLATTPSPDLASAPDLSTTPPRDLSGGDVCHQTGAATACATGGYLLCDGFEGDSGATFTGWSNQTTTNGALGAVATPVCRGSTALQSHAVGGLQAAHVYRTLALGAASYIRTFLYIPSSTDWTTLSYANAFEFGDSTNNGTVNLRFGGANGTVYVERSYAANGPEVGMLARDRWICVEMYVAFSTTAGHVTVWLDEMQVGDYASTPTLNPAGSGTPNKVSVGENATLSTGSGTVDVFYDEVVVSGLRIGCH